VVLVTGGAGFLGAYCVRALLASGHEVRATVRAGSRALPAGAEVVVADLTADAGWREAVAGCEYVLHVASPFPLRAPKHEDELIAPARDGTLRVLRAANASSVRRVVLTSSFAAVGYSGPGPFTEADWTDPEGQSAYVKSKTLAERAAWAFAAETGLELAVINPTAIFGPVLGTQRPTSVELIRRLQGRLPGVPRVELGVVDVRDVADLHLRAMTNPAASGERFLAVAGDFMTVRDIARVLKTRMGAQARRVPTLQLPNWLVRLAAMRDPAVRQILPDLGKPKNATHAKATRVLGWTPRSSEEALVATAESLARLGLLKDSAKQAA
jgi:nucleoside-diphosphate-sugar epimerase